MNAGVGDGAGGRVARRYGAGDGDGPADAAELGAPLQRRAFGRAFGPAARQLAGETAHVLAAGANVADLVGAAIAEHARNTPVKLWSQDEARVGRRGPLTRVWADKTGRPAAPRDQRYTRASLFGAVSQSHAASGRPRLRTP